MQTSEFGVPRPQESEEDDAEADGEDDGGGSEIAGNDDMDGQWF